MAKREYGGGIIEKIMRRFRILVLTPCFLFMEINPSVSWIFIAEIIGCFFPLTHPEIKILQHCFHLPPYLVFSLHIDPDSLCSCIYRAGYTRPVGTDHPWLNKYTTPLRYTHTHPCTRSMQQSDLCALHPICICFSSNWINQVLAYNSKIVNLQSCLQ